MRRELFTTVRSEGGLLPPDLLLRVVEGRGLDGLEPASYGLAEGERLHEAVARSWNRLGGLWTRFRTATAQLPPEDVGLTPTRRNWLLPLFQELGFADLRQTVAHEIEGRRYAVYSMWGGKVPIHLTGFRVDLDRRSEGVPGAARTSPYGLVQDLLNRDPGSLWGMVSNGLRLRLLRDSARLTRQAYVEFDLESMMEGEVYADFALLWLVGHRSRIEAERAEECWLEKWSKAAQQEGGRALERLRGGVEDAIARLGSGFLAHPENARLRERLRTGELTAQDYYRQLLRLAYRLIFLFAAEDRGVLLLPGAEHEPARERYLAFYSTRRLREIAAATRGTRHRDVFESLKLVMGLLGSEQGCPDLALPPLGSFLWSDEALPDVADAALSNAALLEAVRCLAWSAEGGALRPVDYRHLGAEELGSIYEALLEQHPQINTAASTFELKTAAGHERKTTGSYYTPSELVECLLDSALDPVLDDAIARAPREPEQAILSLRVCDPACGSGHFLIAAAHRMARRLAAIRSGDGEPSRETYLAALRDVVGQCLYGVDLNPMAVELCKVSFWLEAVEPGKPLSFLDHHLQCGNSLLGATPELIAQGLPDEAFTAIEGDDKKVASALRKVNRKERDRIEHEQATLFELAEPSASDLDRALAALDETGDSTLAGIREKERLYAAWLASEAHVRAKLLADAWCAAFVWPKTEGTPPAVTSDTLLTLRRDPRAVPEATLCEISRLADEYHFFHWHLAFPEVFGPERGGFDAVLGNPPWDMQEIKEAEFFSVSYPDILQIKSAKEKEKLLRQLSIDAPELWKSYTAHVRRVEAERSFFVNSGRFPLGAIGRLNLFRLFVELDCSISAHAGRVGTVIPSSFLFDSFSQTHFSSILGAGTLRNAFDFENRKGLFPAVDSRYRFCLLTLGYAAGSSAADFVFFAADPQELCEPARHIRMSAADVEAISPISRTPPQFRSAQELRITRLLHDGHEILGRTDRGNWELRPTLMFMMNATMTLHRTADELEASGLERVGVHYMRGRERWAPLYEGKMVAAYDHRAASIRFDPQNPVRRNQPDPLSAAAHADPARFAVPMFWVSEQAIRERVGSESSWFLVVKDVTSATNERTAIAAIVPPVGLTDSVPWLRNTHSAVLNACLLANLNSLPLDFAARQRVGGMHLRGHALLQLPLIPKAAFSSMCGWHAGPLRNWLVPRVLELSVTASDLLPFAADAGYEGPPFRWDEQRRWLIRCELDAAFFHLYGVPRDDVDYIMETFPIVKRKDEAAYGEYRTKRVILEIYDAMQRAIDRGQPYETILDPPPADPRVAHPAS
ncbi:MAG: N-6 DNA methylase [Gemmatimonadales bacterium]|nr:N-6 DNA methylase [Gemmatimonadales bacterium]